jgi:hypothetical protein
MNWKKTKKQNKQKQKTCPSKSLGDILDMLDVCNDSENPFERLKDALLGQFRMSKWQSYFELLHLPMEMQGLKPSILMGKLKQQLPPGISLDNDLFLAMFLVRLPPSMRETVGAGNHETAAAMVNAADALWDAQGATTLQSRPPQLSEVGALLLTMGKDATNGAITPAPKVAPLPALISTPFKTLAMAYVNFTTITATRLTGALLSMLGQKTN